MSVRKPIEARAAPIMAGGATYIAQAKEGPDFGAILSKAASRALPSGAAGGAAMGLNIMCLMWMRTTVNYQYRYGTGTITAIKTLYEDGGRGFKGITRFYRGLVPALFQGPLSRFGDTAANTGAARRLVSQKFGGLRRRHAIDATRVHQTRSGVASFSTLSRFGPRRCSAQVP